MPQRLVIDIGGTNVRFACADASGQLSNLAVVPWQDGMALTEKLMQYRAGLSHPVSFTDVVLDAAGPIDHGQVKLTNRDVVIRAEEVSAHLGGVPVSLLNDLEAVALALPHLSASDVDALRGVTDIGAKKPMIAVNVGTGFGASVVIPIASGWHALPGEGGHMSLMPRNHDEAVFFGKRNTVEDYLSGRGLADLQAEHGNHPMLDRNGEVFSSHLGRVAGDLVVATAAWGGVYLVGGVLEDWTAKGEARSAFLKAFEDKGIMSHRMTKVPIYSVTRPNPALIGLAHYDRALQAV